LEIAEKANPPEILPSDSPYWCSDMPIKTEEGWTVYFFYDCEELDYISHFVKPDGTEIDFWDWEESEAKEILICWRGVGDLDRLRGIYK